MQLAREWPKFAQQVLMASFVAAIVGYAFHSSNGDFTGLFSDNLIVASSSPAFFRVVTLSLVICCAMVRGCANFLCRYVCVCARHGAAIHFPCFKLLVSTGRRF